MSEVCFFTSDDWLISSSFDHIRGLHFVRNPIGWLVQIIKRLWLHGVSVTKLHFWNMTWGSTSTTAKVDLTHDIAKTAQSPPSLHHVSTYKFRWTTKMVLQFPMALRSSSLMSAYDCGWVCCWRKRCVCSVRSYHIAVFVEISQRHWVSEQEWWSRWTFSFTNALNNTDLINSKTPYSGALGIPVR